MCIYLLNSTLKKKKLGRRQWVIINHPVYLSPHADFEDKASEVNLLLLGICFRIWTSFLLPCSQALSYCK